MNEMPSLTIKRIPDQLYHRLRRSAAAHRRSLNSEVLVCLERALGEQRIEPEEFLAEVDALRTRIALPPLTPEILREARTKGRP